MKPQELWSWKIFYLNKFGIGFVMMFLYYFYFIFLNVIFDELYFLHAPLDFKFVCWIGFQFGSCLCGLNLKSIQNVRNTWHAF